MSAAASAVLWTSLESWVDHFRSHSYFESQGSRNCGPSSPGIMPPICNQRRGGTDMNCRFTPIDARNSSLMRALVTVDGFARLSLWGDMNMAPHHCPGEGSRES
jgi:hypothetical protein